MIVFVENSVLYFLKLKTLKFLAKCLICNCNECVNLVLTISVLDNKSKGWQGWGLVGFSPPTAPPPLPLIQNTLCCPFQMLTLFPPTIMLVYHKGIYQHGHSKLHVASVYLYRTFQQISQLEDNAHTLNLKNCLLFSLLEYH